MSISNSGAGRTEPIGFSEQQTTPMTESQPSLSAVISQLDHLIVIVTDLKSKVYGAEHHPSDHPPNTRPIPAPPFSKPFTAQTSTAIPRFTFTPNPSVGTHFTPSTSFQTLGNQSSNIPHTLGQFATSATPHSFAPYGYSESTSMSTGQYRPQHAFTTQWQPTGYNDRNHDRIPVQRPQMINPHSCWGPPGMRPQFGTLSQDQHHTRVKLDPPSIRWNRGEQLDPKRAILI